MKYDILEPFKEYLQENLPKHTAGTYYSAVTKLFKEVQFNSLEQITPEWILENAKENFKTKNEFSAVKNGLKWLGRLHPELQLPTEEAFLNVSSRKRNFSKKRKKVIYLNPTQRKINQISNEKLRYAYRLALVSGLRVSELADLEAEDISFREGKIYVNVRHGKGGHGGVVECTQDTYLMERLPGFLEENTLGKLFYSESYLRQCADKLGIECHDLRRIYAINTRNQLKKEMPIAEANLMVQRSLRHERFSTTKRYLFNRKLKFEYEKTQEPKSACKTDETDKISR